MAHAAQIPTSFGHELRACLRCRLIKTYDQFRESGCENCPFFKMDQDHECVVDCTTPNFTGLISVKDPTRSWAARWLRIVKLGIGGFSMGPATALYSATCFAQGKYGNGNPYPINPRAIVGLSGWLPGSRHICMDSLRTSASSFTTN